MTQNGNDLDSEDDDSDGHILEEEEEDRDYDEDGNLVTGIESDTEWCDFMFGYGAACEGGSMMRVVLSGVVVW